MNSEKFTSSSSPILHNLAHSLNKAEDWDLFKIPEVEKALHEFDGRTSEDVLNRLKKL